MPLKTQFQIVETTTEITSPITKFGGQPVWLSQPYWPIAFETSEKMMFVGQISLESKLFPNSNGTMVYLFIIDECEPLYEEAITTVIQTSDNTYLDNDNFEYAFEPTGPTIYELDENHQAVYKEYKAVLNPIEDEEIIPLEERYTVDDWDCEVKFHFTKPFLAGNKIGGQPLYTQGLTNPPSEFNSQEWLLLMQLAPTQGYWNNLQSNYFQRNFYPFLMELGEFGILTVFISSDYKKTKCYIQQG
ncbi:MAG: DUF1963 domain-containing protein [Prochloraceae cyanobacterium]